MNITIPNHCHHCKHGRVSNHQTTRNRQNGKRTAMCEMRIALRSVSQFCRTPSSCPGAHGSAGADPAAITLHRELSENSASESLKVLACGPSSACHSKALQELSLPPHTPHRLPTTLSHMYRLIYNSSHLSLHVCYMYAQFRNAKCDLADSSKSCWEASRSWAETRPPDSREREDPAA
jgi:hypothetical protein